MVFVLVSHPETGVGTDAGDELAGLLRDFRYARLNIT